jgi:hypothetical protein
MKGGLSEMKGITAYGMYLPYYRLKRETIFRAMGWFNPGIAGLAKGEKTVANYDEDSLTMAVAAGIDCLRDVEREKIDALYIASTTLPYKERGNASIAGAALNLSPNTRTARLAGSRNSSLEMVRPRLQWEVKALLPRLSGTIQSPTIFQINGEWTGIDLYGAGKRDGFEKPAILK